MATCATLGEAAGTAAAMCAALGVTPRELHERHRRDLVQTLLRQDASVLGVANDDPADLARRARVSASSHLPRVAVPSGGDAWPLTCDVGVTLPVQRRLDTLSLLVGAERDTTLTVEVFDVSKPQNFVPNERLTSATVEVAAGDRALGRGAARPRARRAELRVRGDPRRRRRRPAPRRRAAVGRPRLRAPARRDLGRRQRGPQRPAPAAVEPEALPPLAAQPADRPRRALLRARERRQRPPPPLRRAQPVALGAARRRPRALAGPDLGRAAADPPHRDHLQRRRQRGPDQPAPPPHALPRHPRAGEGLRARGARRRRVAGRRERHRQPRSPAGARRRARRRDRPAAAGAGDERQRATPRWSRCGRTRARRGVTARARRARRSPPACRCRGPPPVQPPGRSRRRRAWARCW
jgi:hypothetical protein